MRMGGGEYITRRVRAAMQATETKSVPSLKINQRALNFYLLNQKQTPHSAGSPVLQIHTTTHIVFRHLQLSEPPMSGTQLSGNMNPI